MVRAFRDTWKLGVHSYLSYLRDRLYAARALLTESGSIFVQIGVENVHLVRALLDEMFGRDAFQAQIVFYKTTGKGAQALDAVYDILLWYARTPGKVKYRPIYCPRGPDEDYNLRWIEWLTGARTHVQTAAQVADAVAQRAKVFRPNPLTSPRPRGANDLAEFCFQGKDFSPGKNTFKTELNGMKKLAASNRLIAQGDTIGFIRYLDDFPFKTINNIWDDTRQSGFGDEKVYVVQTGNRVVERCILMTTDPGDLVVDPTCGSGTTAVVAEQWGRRWITVDTSRVAVAIARQRLVTSRFEHYKTRGMPNRASGSPGAGFVYKTVAHITLKSIVQTAVLDAVIEKHESALETALAACSKSIANIDTALRRRLRDKLIAKQRAEGSRAITDADRRRWEFPSEKFEHWTIPFDTDPDWPKPLAERRPRLPQGLAPQDGRG